MPVPEYVFQMNSHEKALKYRGRNYRIMSSSIPFTVSIVLLCVLTFFSLFFHNDEILYQIVNPELELPIFITRCGHQQICLKFHSPSSWRQSVITIGDPDHIEMDYAKCLLMTLLFVQNINRVLVIGLGGGTLPHYIHHHFPDVRVDVAEIVQEVVELQLRYFGFNTRHPNIHVAVEDGEEFLRKQPENCYDLILVDGGSLMSITEGGTQLLYSKLTDSGVVGLNAFYEEDWNRDKVENLYKNFAEVWVMETYTVNSPLIACKKASRLTHSGLIERARVVEGELRTKLKLSAIAEEKEAAKRVFSIKGIGR